MLKQSPSRGQRPKGFKVKHVLHICVLLAVCIWLLYQVNHSRDKKAAYEEDSALEILKKFQNGRDEIMKLGRRDLHPLVKDAPFDIEKHRGEEEGSRFEESDQEDVRGGGDDEIDGRDQESAEEEESERVEDLIDEEDREMDEGSEELEGEEDKGIDFKDVSLLEDQILDEQEGKNDIQEAREEHYKGDDDNASGSVMQNMQTISGSLRRIQENEVENKNKFEVGKETEALYTKDLSVGVKGSETEGHLNLRAKSSGCDNATRVQVGNEFASSRSKDALYSSSLVKAEATQQSKEKNDSAMLLVKGPTSFNGTSNLRQLIQDSNLTSNGRESYSQGHSNLTLSVVDNVDAAQKGVEVLNGSCSNSAQGTLQFDENDGTQKSTDGSSASSGESKANDGLQSGEESSKISTADDNLDAAKNDSPDFEFYQEDREAHSALVDG